MTNDPTAALRGRRRRPTRRAVVAGAAVGLGLAAGVLAGIQMRAVEAREQRDVVAAAEASQREQDRTRAAAADDARAQAAARLAASWQAAVDAAHVALAGARAVHDGSAGAVPDDAVRVALAASIATVEELVADEGLAGPLARAVTGLGAATQAVEEAQAAQRAALAAEAAEQEAAAEAARRPATASAGAGPDCGGPGSYEPPTDDLPVFYTSTPTAQGDGSNGNVPASALSPLGWCRDSQGNQQWLRKDAAAALTQLNEAFRAEFGENLAVDLSYRSYADQVAMRDHYGSVAARPGTSSHGWGTAFDTWEWAAYGFGTARYTWLVSNGPSSGWVAPSWAREDGSNPEYWHFEYTG